MSDLKSILECMRQCKCCKHGDAITSAITKRAVSDAALASYMRCTCANFTQILDNEGRTALHMAVSTGRQQLVEWLVKMSSGTSMNSPDRESGYTALHRSIFYGQIHIAVALMKMGVNVDILDRDDYKAMDHAMLDRSEVSCYNAQQPCDVYVWGSNSNYTLGTGTQHQRNTPDILNCFSRQHSTVIQVCLGKFHSVWVDSAGAAWGCGQAWRLGADDAVGTLLRPARLRLPEPCVQAALTLDTTVFLLQSGSVVQYGSSESVNNIRNQTRGKKCELVELANVKPLVRLSGARGLCASRQHCVVWTDSDVLTWGVNVGQLGHSQPQDKTINNPKKILSIINSNEGYCIRCVAACDAATVISNSRGDVYLLHKYLCKKITTKQINLKQIAVEGRMKEHEVTTDMTVLLLTNVGDILIWQHPCSQLTRCVFGASHSVTATHVALSDGDILLTTVHGRGYVGKVTGRRVRPALVSGATDEKGRGHKQQLCVVLVTLRGLPNVHRAVAVTADVEGCNYAVLQVRPSWGVASYPQISPSSIAEDMSVLLSECSTEDPLHDLVFEVGNRLFPAHAFIIANGSDYLYQLCQNAVPGETVTVEGVHADVFERILEYLYTGSCDVLRSGRCGLKVARASHQRTVSVAEQTKREDTSQLSAFEVHNKVADRKGRGGKAGRDRGRHEDPVQLLRGAARQLHIPALERVLTHIYCEDGYIHEKDALGLAGARAEWRLRGDEHHALADVALQGEAGRTLPPLHAHKCVLAARLHYFHGMFMHAWTENENKSVIKLPIKENILRQVVEFLYSDACPALDAPESVDFVCSLLVVADQLFIDRLRQMCEVAIADLVTLKNCAEMLQFADTYNSPQLKVFCMEYISMNLCVFLENRLLQRLSENVLEDLTKFYCSFYPIMSSRIVTPFSCAVDDDAVVMCADRFPVDLHEIDDEYVKENEIVLSKKKNKLKKKEHNEKEKASMTHESVRSVDDIKISTGNARNITLNIENLRVAEENSERKEKWIKVQSPQDKLQKIVQARLRVVSEAKKTPLESFAENFTTLTKCMELDSPDRLSQKVTSPVTLSSRVAEEVQDYNTSPRGSISINHVSSTKLSQKQRKKLTMERKDSIFYSGPSIRIPHKAVGTSPKSKNPWKIAENCAVETNAVCLDDIREHQRREKEHLCRMVNKPLHMTQLEDKAIEELEKFYNVQETDEEQISVYRIDRNIQSSPQWINGNTRSHLN